MSEKLPLSPYDPNATKDVSYHYVDEHNLVLLYKENKGIGDCIGRTMTAYMCYDDPKLIEGIENLWQFRDEFGGKMVGIRHPDILDATGEYVEGYWYNRMSRDHYIYTLVALKMNEDRMMYKNQKLKDIVESTPFKIKRMSRWTLGLILWSKGLIGNKTALWFYLILEIILTNLIYVPLRKLGYKLTGWKDEVDQDEWGWTHDIDPKKQSIQWQNDHILQSQPKWKQRIDKIIYPSYAVRFSAYQLYVTPNTFPKLKRTLQKSLLKMVGETNYVQRMLLGDKNIPREKVEEFKPMLGGRWSGYLTGRNDRTMIIIKDGKYTVNLLTVDEVRSLYNRTQIEG